MIDARDAAAQPRRAFHTMLINTKGAIAMNIRRRGLQGSLAPTLLALGIACAAAPLPARAADPISFVPGNPWTQTIGSVSKDSDYHEYTVNASAGKTLQINLISRNPNLFFRVSSPDSHTPLIDTQKTGDTTWTTKTAADTAYTVRVYEDPDTVHGGDVTRFALQVGSY